MCGRGWTRRRRRLPRRTRVRRPRNRSAVRARFVRPCAVRGGKNSKLTRMSRRAGDRLHSAAANTSALSVRSHAKLVLRAPEVTVRGCLTIDRPLQVEHVDQPPGPQVEILSHEMNDRRLFELAGTESVDADRGWFRYADRIADLDLAAFGDARGDDVLGHVPARVGGGSIHLRRVLAGKCAPAGIESMAGRKVTE